MSADSKPCAATEDNSFAVCLRVTLLIQCLGLCLALQKADLPLRIWLDRQLGSSLLVQLLVVLAAVSAITILYRPMRVVVMGLGILLLVNFLSEAAMSTSLELLLKPFSHSARYLIPFALLLLPKSMSAAVWLMRVAAAATFFGHGIQALARSPHFIELIQSSGEQLLRLSISPAVAGKMLLVIGTIDLALAIAIVLARWRFVSGYMSAWGVLTAVSRTAHFGLTGIHETLMRAPNAGAPLALFLLWHLRHATKGQAQNWNLE